MDNVNKKFIILINLIESINILNIALLIGMFLARLSINRYISLLLILVSCSILAYVSQKILIKKLGASYSLYKSKIFSIFAIILNIFMLAYYAVMKEYIIICIIVLFMVIYMLLLKSKGSKEKITQM